ncbi:polysaccharide pyruvyl transferase family protein [Neptuniibacter sp. QD72_48]|uniref:polysaccharide pyruvyl transferase family protein n=1 Tax=unclassified Neptuniibacter TaxID=2630693 RepID=UPI0039F5F264
MSERLGLKILHIASFVGNIGDNANHQGVRRTLSERFSGIHTYTELEIRKCYRIYTGGDRWEFDLQFASLANQHDLIIIGGGNFFEPWLPESSTGTTIDLSKEILDKIHSPILFYGVGFDTYKHCPAECLQKFQDFVVDVSERSNVILTFRNDGSLKNYKKTYGAMSEAIDVVPDGGFFYQPDCKLNFPFDSKNEYWGINLASDMKDVRFPEGGKGNITWEGFLRGFAAVLSTKLTEQENLQLIFFPHIYKDLEAISELLAYMDDRFCRDRIQTAPYSYGWDGADKVFSLYNSCSLIMGMRFHTNVCAMGMNIPSIGLSSSPKLEDLYEEIGLRDRIVRINKDDCMQKLLFLLSKMNEKPHIFRQQNNTVVDRLRNDVGLFWDKLALLLDKS